MKSLSWITDAHLDHLSMKIVPTRALKPLHGELFELVSSDYVIFRKLQ